jgi:phytanoyl-CoA hydroxylase
MEMTDSFTFDTDGFTIRRGLFTEQEVTGFKQEICRLLETHEAHGGVFVGLAANSLVFRELAGDTRLLDELETILGPNIEFLSDKVVLKSAATDYGSPWHQDWPYWKGIHKVSVWIALDPATPENGCLKLLPGSCSPAAIAPTRFTMATRAARSCSSTGSHRGRWTRNRLRSCRARRETRYSSTI